MNIADYQAKVYGPQPCWELVADVYANETDTPIDVGYTRATRSVREMAAAFRVAIHVGTHGFVKVEEPVDLDIVLLARHAAMGPHHCGIYWQGGVLHAQPGATLYESLETVRDTFALVEFWRRAEVGA